MSENETTLIKYSCERGHQFSNDECKENWKNLKICPYCFPIAFKYKEDQKCNFCLNPESIITKDTCCTGCSVLEKLNNTNPKSV